MKDRTTSDFFNHYSKAFDDIYGKHNNYLRRVVNTIFRRSMRLRFERTFSACQPVIDHTVLDIGCGPGLYAVTFATLGAKKVKGIDFSPEMINLARNRASAEGVADKCEFELIDFVELAEDTAYNYVILMGFMDYIQHPEAIISKAIRLTKNKAVFSFPASGGLLAWQRKLRYKLKCPIYFYSEAQIHALFAQLGNVNYDLERISRDYFVTVKV